MTTTPSSALLTMGWNPVLSHGDISLRDLVASLYDAWWDKRAPERDRHERAAATAARRKAIVGNWCAGAGLDDDELDTPGYKPKSRWKPAAGTGTAPGVRPSARTQKDPGARSPRNATNRNQASGKRPWR